MTAHVKIPRHLLDGKRSSNAASVFVPDRIPDLLHLSVRVLLPKQFVAAFVDVLAILVESPLFNRADVGMVRDHDIFEVQRDKLAREGRKSHV